MRLVWLLIFSLAIATVFGSHAAAGILLVYMIIGGAYLLIIATTQRIDRALDGGRRAGGSYEACGQVAQNSLKGLSGFYLEIRNEDGSKVLDVPAIRTETELRMRQAGIQVRGPEELNQFLIIQSDGRLIMFSLIEPATLDRDSTRAWAITWSLTGYGGNARRMVYDAVSEFLNQWLAENPGPKLQLPDLPVTVTNTNHFFRSSPFSGSWRSGCLFR
jgi:hypothetical protein